MIPRNWRWSTLENVSDVIMGQSPNGEETTSDSTYIPLIGGAADMGNLFPIITRYTKVPTKLSQKDDVIICVRATLGRPIYSDGVYCLGRGVAAIRSNILIKEYIRYFLINNEQYLYENATGSTFLQITSIKLKSMPIPVPPLDEQQRIVDIIENLFSKLDKAKSLAQNIIDNYEIRKNKILYETFNGKLTLKWRQRNNINFDTWHNIPLNKAFDIKSGFSIPISEEKSKGQIPYVKVADMNLPENKIQIITSSRFVDNYNKNNIIPIGSTIFPKRGGAIFTNKKRYIGKINIIADLNIMAIIPIHDKIVGLYGYFWMLSVDLKNLNNGSMIPQINNKDMIRLFVPLPTIEEQKEIVRILDSLLNKEQRTKELAEQILQKIDLMKKSILARAFRGELN